MKIAFLKEAGKLVQKEFTHIELIDWFKDNTNDIGEVKEEIFLFGGIDIKADEGEGFPWVLSDMTLDRDMERMDPSGWDLKQYRKNPIVLWGHDSWEPAIGVMKNIKGASDEKGELTGTIYFDESGDDPMATKIASKVRQGILTKGSVGFMTKQIEILEGARDGTRLIHRKMELMEFSVCNIPANPSASIRRSMDAPDPWRSGYMRIEGEESIQQTETLSATTEHYFDELLQADEDRKTSDLGKTSLIDSLFQEIPEKGKSNIGEIFNEN